MKTDENMGRVWTLVRTDRYLGVRMIAEELNMDKGIVINFNRFEHGKSVSQNCPKESSTFQPENKYPCSNTLCTHQILPHVTFFFSQN